MSTRPSQRHYNVAYYRRNRQREIDRVVARQRATLELLRDLRRVPCMDCGESFQPHQMDFHHRDPKTKCFNVTSSEAMLKRRDLLLAEVAKCDVICANCHAARTYALQVDRWIDRRRWRTLKGTAKARARRLRELQKRELLLILRDGPCRDCERRLPPYLMHLDHRDPDTKLFNLSAAWSRADSVIVREALKCDIVCPNCHRERTLRWWSRRAGVL